MQETIGSLNQTKDDLQKTNDNLIKKQEELNTKAEEARKQELIAKINAHEADRQRLAAEAATRKAEEQLAYARRSLYALQLNQASAVMRENPVQAQELLNDETRAPAELRDFTWKLLRHLSTSSNLQVLVDGGTSLNFFADGKTAAAGTYNGSLKLLDLVTGAQRESQEQLGSPIRSLLLYSGDKACATASDDGTIALWDLTKLQIMGRLPAAAVGDYPSITLSHDRKMLAAWGKTGVRVFEIQPVLRELEINFRDGDVKAVAFSSREHMLAIIQRDGRVLLCNTTTGLIEGASRSSGINSVAFAPTGLKLAMGADDGRVIFWNKLSSEEIESPERHSGSVDSFEFSPDGSKLASLSRGQRRAESPGEIKLWEMPAGRKLATLVGEAGYNVSFYSMVFSPDGNVLATGETTDVRLWDVATGLELKVLQGSGPFVSSLSFSPDAKTLVAATTGFGMSVKSWGLEERKYQKIQLEEFNGHIKTAEFTADGEIVAASTARGSVTIWDTNTGKKWKRIEATGLSVTDLAFSVDKNTLVSSHSSQIYLHDLVTARSIPVFRNEPPTIFVASSKDSRIVAVGNSNNHQQYSSSGGLGEYSYGKVKLWSKQTGQSYAMLDGDLPIFSPDEQTLAIVNFDGAVKLWNPFNGVLKATLSEPADGSTLISNLLGAFSRNGRILAVAHHMSVKLWDVGSGKNTGVLKGHTQPITSISFSNDGKTIATSSDDGTIRLWDSVTGQERAILRTEGVRVEALSFLPNDRALVALEEEGHILIWRSQESTRTAAQN